MGASSKRVCDIAVEFDWLITVCDTIPPDP